MSKVLKRRWSSSLRGSALSQKDARPCECEAYVPDPLVGRRHCIVRLNTEASALVDTEALARILLRAEALAPSRIEGLVIGARCLLRAEVIRKLKGTTGPEGPVG
jgi:hypothetical protein